MGDSFDLPELQEYTLDQLLTIKPEDLQDGLYTITLSKTQAQESGFDIKAFLEDGENVLFTCTFNEKKDRRFLVSDKDGVKNRDLSRILNTLYYAKYATAVLPPQAPWENTAETVPPPPKPEDKKPPVVTPPKSEEPVPREEEVEDEDSPLTDCERKLTLQDFVLTPIEDLPSRQIICIEDRNDDFQIIPDEKQGNFIFYKGKVYFFVILDIAKVGGKVTTFKLAVLENDGSVNKTISQNLTQFYKDFQEKLIKMKGKGARPVVPVTTSTKKGVRIELTERVYEKGDTDEIKALRNKLYAEMDNLKKLQAGALPINLEITEKPGYTPLHMLDEDFFNNRLNYNVDLLHIIPLELLEKFNPYYYVKNEIVEFAKAILSKKDTVKDYDPTYVIKDDFDRQMILMEKVRRHFFEIKIKELKQKYLQSQDTIAAGKFIEILDANTGADNERLQRIIKDGYDNSNDSKEKNIYNIIATNFDAWIKLDRAVLIDIRQHQLLNADDQYLVEHDDERIAEELDMSKPNSAYPHNIGKGQNAVTSGGTDLIRPHYHKVIDKEGHSTTKADEKKITELFKTYLPREKLIDKKSKFRQATEKYTLMQQFIAKFGEEKYKEIKMRAEKYSQDIKSAEGNDERINEIQTEWQEYRSTLSPDAKRIIDFKKFFTDKDDAIYKQGGLTEEENRLLDKLNEDPDIDEKKDEVDELLKNHEYIEVDTLLNNITGGLLIEPSYRNPCIRSAEFDDNYEEKQFELGCKRPYTLYQLWRIFRNNTSGKSREEFKNLLEGENKIYDILTRPYSDRFNQKKRETENTLNESILEKENLIALAIQEAKEASERELVREVRNIYTDQVDKYQTYTNKVRGLNDLTHSEFSMYFSSKPNNHLVFCPYCAGFVAERSGRAIACRFLYRGDYETLQPRHTHIKNPNTGKLPIDYTSNQLRDICSVCNGPCANHDHYILDSTGSAPDSNHGYGNYAYLCSGDDNRTPGANLDRHCLADGGGGVLEAVARNLAYRDYILERVQNNPPQGNFGIQYHEMAEHADRYARIIRSKMPSSRLANKAIPDQDDIYARSLQSLIKGKWASNKKLKTIWRHVGVDYPEYEIYDEPEHMIRIPEVPKPESLEVIDARVRREKGVGPKPVNGPKPPPKTAPKPPTPPPTTPPKTAPPAAKTYAEVYNLHHDLTNQINKIIVRLGELETAGNSEEVTSEIANLTSQLGILEEELEKNPLPPAPEGGSSKKLQSHRRTHKVKKHYRRKTRITK